MGVLDKHISSGFIVANGKKDEFIRAAKEDTVVDSILARQKKYSSVIRCVSADGHTEKKDRP